MTRIRFIVNGHRRTAETEPDTPLVWVLRDVLDLRGTKYGCGQGQCGSCTVLLDGRPVRSCIIPASLAAHRRITTIEGLDRDRRHPLVRAWLDEGVTQCGYCQPAQLLTAAALLERTPHPADWEIDAAMDGILCRCGTYGRIRRAIHRAAGEPRR